jgi:hypothetical protein
VCRDELGGLLGVQPQHVAAQHRQLAQQLRHEPAHREVPPGEQHQPHPVRVDVQLLVDEGDAGSR